MNFNRLPEISGEQCNSVREYDASVDFSNACRSLYFDRVKRTKEYKDKMDKCEEKGKEKRRKSSMETAMELLGKEMASLMEQDLSLMRQLLTMNEAVEDIKNRRLYGSFSKDGLRSSSSDILEKDYCY